ncbi:MAG: hypothetical protein LBD67_03000 [Candidatus Accumulibacter sp.]|nr:hypothetical protein [Accumulibacter sp.]
MSWIDSCLPVEKNPVPGVSRRFFSASSPATVWVASVRGAFLASLLCLGGLLAAPALRAADISVTGAAIVDVCGNSSNAATGDCAAAASGVSGKSVEVSGSGSVNGAVYGGYEKDFASASAYSTTGNAAIINTSGTITDDVAGGYVASRGEARVRDNDAILSSGTVKESVFGGFASSATTSAQVTYNRVEISGGEVKGVYGGNASASGNGNVDVNENQVTISGGQITNVVYGGRGSSDAGAATVTENEVAMTGGMANYVYGGNANATSGDAEARDNHVNISNTQIAGDAMGGISYSGSGTAAAVENNVIMTGGGADNVYGGEANARDGGAEVRENRVEISGGAQVSDRVVGGLGGSSSGTATVTDNRVEVSDSRVDNDIYGGSAWSSNDDVEASENRVNVSNTTVGGDVYGGIGETFNSGFVTVTDNRVDFSANATGSVYGGEAESRSGGAEVSKNRVEISGGQVGVNVVGGIGVSTLSGAVTVEENRVVITAGGVEGDVFGGDAWSSDTDKATAASNRIEISGGAVRGYYIGNRATSVYGLSEASKNTITITGGTMGDSDVIGGWAGSPYGAVKAEENRVELDGQGQAATEAYRVYGGYASTNGAGASATVMDNSIRISGNILVKSDVYGADVHSGNGGNAVAERNRVEMTGGTVRTTIYGGSGSATAAGSATVTENRVDFSGGVAGDVYGGEAATGSGNAEARENRVDISGGQINNSAVGGRGFSDSGSVTVTENRIEMTGGSAGEHIYGGKGEARTGSATVTKNRVEFSGGTVTKSVYGGHVSAAASATVTENRVEFSGTASAKDVHGGYAQTKSGQAVIEKNHVEFSGGAAQTVHGGFGTATQSGGRVEIRENTVAVSGGQISTAVYGGNATNPFGASTVKENAIDISGGSAAAAYGGYASAAADSEAIDNRLTISGGTVSGNAVGGMASSSAGSATASDNTLTISGGTVSRNVIGGWSSSNVASTATNNTVNLEGVITFGSNSQLLGGNATGTGTKDAFTGNTLNLKTTRMTTVRALSNFENLNFYLPAGMQDGDTFLRVNGTADLTNGSGVSSQVKTIGLEFNQNISPGDTIKLIQANTLTSLPGVSSTVTGTTPDGVEADWKVGANSTTLYAFLKRMETRGDLNRPNGFRVRSSSSEDVTLIVDGTLNAGGTGLTVDNSAGGGVRVNVGRMDATSSDIAIALNNTAAWNGTDGVRFGHMELGNGHTVALSGNGGYKVDTYTVHGMATFDGNLNAAGSILNFQLPATAGDGATMLNVTGTAAVSGSTVGIGINGATSPLKGGDTVTLIDAAGGLTGASANQETVAYGTSGAMLRYEFDLTTDANRLNATVKQLQTNSALSEGYLSSASLLTRGADLLAGRGMQNAWAAADPYRPRIFAALGNGKMHYDTRSHLSLQGFTLATGAANGFRTHTGDATVAAFFEYGKGSYAGRDTFASMKIKGRGDTGYKGIGLTGRLDFEDGTWLGGSLRGGRAETSYRSNDLLGRKVDFDARSGYVGAHLEAGENQKLNEQDTLNTYVQLLWTRQGKDTITPSEDERVKFSAINSKRIKLGARIERAVSKEMSGYAGIAYEHEFGGDARARETTRDIWIETPSLKGGTCVVEMGLSGQPAANKPLYLDFGIQGYAGKREGVIANFRVNYFF